MGSSENAEPDLAAHEDLAAVFAEVRARLADLALHPLAAGLDPALAGPDDVVADVDKEQRHRDGDGDQHLPAHPQARIHEVRLHRRIHHQDPTHMKQIAPPMPNSP